MPRCNCGFAGDLESVASLSGIANNLLPFWLTRYPDHPLGRVDIGSPPSSVREYGERGDEMARRIFEQQAMAIGRMFTIAANFTDPDAYFVGGGVTDASAEFRDWFLDRVRDATQLREEQAGVAMFALVPDLDMAGARGRRSPRCTPSGRSALEARDSSVCWRCVRQERTLNVVVPRTCRWLGSRCRQTTVSVPGARRTRSAGGASMPAPSAAAMVNQSGGSAAGVARNASMSAGPQPGASVPNRDSSSGLPDRGGAGLDLQHPWARDQLTGGGSAHVRFDQQVRPLVDPRHRLAGQSLQQHGFGGASISPDVDIRSCSSG